jgi:Zn-dependent protease
MHEGPGRCPGPLCSPALRELRCGNRFREAALASRRCVLVDEPLSRRAIEQLHRQRLHLGRRIGCPGILERGPERGALGAITNGGGAGLPHVLLRGGDIGHETLQILRGWWARLEPESYARTSRYVKAPHNFDARSPMCCGHACTPPLPYAPTPLRPPTPDPRVALDQSTLTRILLTIPVLLFALVAHEWAHAYAALKQGDPTAYELGRLTFNPIKHIDPFMTLILPAVMLIGSHGAIALGGAKPCPVDPRNFRNYKRGDIIVSLAGVTMNLLLAVLSAVLFLLFGIIGQAIPGASSVFAIVQQMLEISVLYNSLLLFFNLIPIPPLDGSHVLAHFLPPALALQYKRVSRFGLLILVGLLYFGGDVLNVLLSPVGVLVHALMRPVLPFALGMQ